MKTQIAAIALTLMTSTACASPTAQRSATTAPALTTRTYTAGDAGFRVNSHLIEGQREAILVDAQFTRSEATKVAELVAKSSKKLTAIFVTHGHPDHYLGLEILKQRFPKAKILARPEVIQDIAKTAPGKLAYWKPIYKDDLADGFTLPEPYTQSSLTIEDQRVDLIDLVDGEAEHATALYIPSARTLLTGDASYNEVHLWLAENRPEGWLKQLEVLKSAGAIDSVLPGHGAIATAELLDANEEYIRDFMNFTLTPATKKQALESLTKKYGNFALPIIAELSVGARIAE